MNYESSVIRYVILSALIGFVAFIFCYSYVVWKKRQTAAEGNSSSSQKLRAFGLFALVFGIGGMVFSMASREVVKASGTITGDDLFTVRTIEGLHASYRANEGPIRKGDKLVSFAGTELDLAITKARATVLKQEAKLQKVEADLLPRDPELIRQLTRASNRVDQLEIMLRQLVPNAEVSDREGLTEITKIKNDLHKIEGEYITAKATEKQALETMKIVQSQLDRDADLVSRGAISIQDYQDRLIAYRKIEAQKTKAESTLKSVEAQKKELTLTLSKLLEFSRSTQIPKELAHIQKDLELARVEETAAKKALDTDLPRAQKLHALEIVQAQKELEGARGTLTNLEQSREIVAPFSGEVVYKNLTQDTPKLRGPLLVLAGENGLLCKVRLPQNQLSALKNGESVTLQATTETGGPPYTFDAKFKDQAKTSASDPLVTGVFQCTPPPEVVAKLSEGEPVKVTLDWRPPLWTLWPFQIGSGLVVIGLACWMFSTSIAGGSPTVVQKPTAKSQVLPIPKSETVVLFPSKSSVPVLPTFASIETIRPAIPHIDEKNPPQIEPVAPPTIADLYSAASRETLPELKITDHESEEKLDYELVAWNLCQAIHAGTVTVEQVDLAERALAQGGPMATMFYRRTFRNDPILLNSISRLWSHADTPETHHVVLRLDRLIASVGIIKPVMV